MRLKDLRLYILYSFRRRCFSDLITHQHFSCPSVSSLRYSLRETNLKVSMRRQPLWQVHSIDSAAPGSGVDSIALALVLHALRSSRSPACAHSCPVLEKWGTCHSSAQDAPNSFSCPLISFLPNKYRTEIYQCSLSS